MRGSEEVRLGVISDVHISLVEGDTVRWHGELDLEQAHARLSSALAFLASEEVDVVVVAGDLTHHGDPPAIARAIELLEHAQVPVFVVPGNHDGEARSTLDAVISGRPASNVQIASHGGTVLAPGLRLAGRGDQPTEEPFLTSPNDTSRWGDDLVIWLTHFPVVSLASLCEESGLLYAGDAGDLDIAEREIARREAPTIVLAGHLHVRHAELRRRMLQLTMAALAEAPGDVAVVEITRGGRTSVRRRVWESDRQPGQRLPVFAPLDETFVLEFSGSWARAANAEPPDIAVPSQGLGVLAFDWNGTLVDDGDAAWHATCAVLQARDLPALSRQAFSDAFCLPLPSFFDSLGIEDALLATDEWNEFMGSTDSDLMLGAREMLEDLRADGVVLGVVSAAASEVVARQVAKHGLTELFAFIEAGAPNKREALSRLGRLAPGRVAYLGDTEYDMDEARAAGIRAWAFAGGYRPADALASGASERIISSLDELRDLVRTAPSRPSGSSVA